MAHFAQLDENNDVVQVVVLNNSIITDGDGVEQESLGVTHLQNIYGEDTTWKMTSYNTRHNKHWTTLFETESDDQTKAFRGNFASVGGSYDAVNDIFITPRPKDYYNNVANSWTWNTTDAKWESPIAIPSDDGVSAKYGWVEADYQADNTAGWLKLAELDSEGNVVELVE